MLNQITGKTHVMAMDAPDPADWHLTEVETLSLWFHGGPGFGSYDGDGYLLSASQSGLALPDAAVGRLDQLSSCLIPETGVCAYMIGSSAAARIWTKVMADLVVQVVQVTCEVGTGSIPEGMVAVLVADLQGNGSATVLAEDAIEPYEGLLEAAPEPALRLGLAANPHAAWQLWPLADDMVALTAAPDAVVLLDPKRGRVGLISDPGAGLDAVSLMAPSPDFATLVQANRDGRVILRDMATGDRLAEGAYLDDELVLAFADGTFRWTAEGARHARVKFAGDPVAYALDQLAPPGPDGSFALPPRLSLAEPVAEARPAAVDLTARAEAGLAALEV